MYGAALSPEKTMIIRRIIRAVQGGPEIFTLFQFISGCGFDVKSENFKNCFKNVQFHEVFGYIVIFLFFITALKIL